MLELASLGGNGGQRYNRAGGIGIGNAGLIALYGDGASVIGRADDRQLLFTSGADCGGNNGSQQKRRADGDDCDQPKVFNANIRFHLINILHPNVYHYQLRVV